jgi:hypothetical protein
MMVFTDTFVENQASRHVGGGCRDRVMHEDAATGRKGIMPREGDARRGRKLEMDRRHLKTPESEATFGDATFGDATFGDATIGGAGSG